MSPRLASARTSRPAARACCATAASAAQPGAPRRSKQAELRLDRDAGRAGRVDDRRAVRGDRVRGPLGRRARAAAAAARLGHSRGGSGSSPRTTWDSRSATRPASRSAKRGPASALSSRALRRPMRAAGGGGVGVGCVRLDGLLQTRARREARHLGCGDVDRLARARVRRPGARRARRRELAEARERDIAAALERLLDRLQDRVHGLPGLLLVQARAVGDLIDEL